VPCRHKIGVPFSAPYKSNDNFLPSLSVSE
jgi:hypothetical protein